MPEEKIKIKAGGLLFFLVGDNFYISEDPLTVRYSESGLTTYGQFGVHIKNPNFYNIIQVYVIFYSTVPF